MNAVTEALPSTMQAIVAREPGDASVLVLAERPVPLPLPASKSWPDRDRR